MEPQEGEDDGAQEEAAAAEADEEEEEEERADAPLSQAAMMQQIQQMMQQQMLLSQQMVARIEAVERARGQGAGAPAKKQAAQQQKGAPEDDEDEDDEEEEENDDPVAPSSMGASSVAGAARRIEYSKRALHTPALLLWVNASNMTKLEDWREDCETLFEQLEQSGALSEHTKIVEARWSMDRPLKRWLNDAREEALRQGKPIDSWKGVISAMRKYFLPISAPQIASDAFMAVTQHSGEAMDTYMLRALRAWEEIPDERKFVDSAAMQMVLNKARTTEWPQTLRRAQRAIDHKKVTTMAQLHLLLMNEAQDEPQRPHTSSSASSSAPQPFRNPGGSNNKFTKKPVRAAALRAFAESLGMELVEDEGAGAPGGLTAVNALGKGKPARGGTGGWEDRGCARCGDKSHKVAECKKPDDRVCYKCNKPGHLRRDCPKNE